MKQTLGTQLRHLLELLDGAVQDAYTQAGLAYRPRYTPVMRAINEHEPSTIGEIAISAAISQPSATQTVALMIKEGLLSSTSGPGDGRQRLISFDEKGRELLPHLQTCWKATGVAAGDLDDELSSPLSTTLAEAIAALEEKSFAQRIADARAKLLEEIIENQES